METSLTVTLEDTKQVSVLLPLAVGQGFDYTVSDGQNVEAGSYVRVPLRGKTNAYGVVWGRGNAEISAKKIKPIAEIVDLPPLPDITRKFIEWVAAYTMSSLGMVLRMVLNVPAALEPQPIHYLYRLAEIDMKAVSVTPKRRQVLAALSEGRSLTLGDLAREAGVGTSVVKGLVSLGLIEAVVSKKTIFPQPLDPQHAVTKLSAAQEVAASTLRQAVQKNRFQVALLDGVTGSGKTEVYFEAIATALLSNRQVLVLLPEISLSEQFISRFIVRFGAAPAIWHSDLTMAQRRDTWRGVAEATIRVVIGARSALFLPYSELGLIVIDEEHDTSFKQEEGVIYHARDMAVVRAKLGEFPCILVSATPSLETLNNVELGRYQHLTLPARFGGATLPHVSLVDLRLEKLPPKRFISHTLEQAIAETLASGEQVLLFLNRRGYAPLTLCRQCGHRISCPHCTAWLVEHRSQGRLRCHYCGHTEGLPHECPNCAAEGSFAAVGPGVERIAEEAQALFPTREWP